MKGVIHSQYGSPDVLQVTTLERPEPQKNEVLIRVKAAGLDYGQWHLGLTPIPRTQRDYTDVMPAGS